MEKLSIDVRTFSSMEEVRESVPNFVNDLPLSQTNYKRLIGDYSFADEVRCCFLKENGKLCGEAHKKGWVAELTDGSATIVGNDCAKQKFGADSKFIVDRSRYLNEQRLRRQLAAVHRQLEERAERLARLGQIKTELLTLETRITTFTNSLGSQTLWSLQSMQRSGSPEVRVKAVKFRESTDHNGNVTRDRSVFSHSLGALRGLDLVQPASFSTLYRVIKSIEWAYHDAEKLPERPKSKEIESLASRLNEYDRVLREGNHLLQLEGDFFNNRFLLLCFLSTDKSERFKSAKVAMHQAGVNGNKDDAKVWLGEQERAIREQLAVDAIEIR